VLAVCLVLGLIGLARLVLIGLVFGLLGLGGLDLFGFFVQV